MLPRCWNYRPHCMLGRLLSVWLVSGVAHAALAMDESIQTPHEHGLAHLQITISDKTLELTLATPMINLVGFDHAPTDHAEQQQILAAKQPLEEAQHLFGFSQAAQCELQHTAIASSLFINPPVIQTPVRAVTSTDTPSNRDHNDWDITWTYYCEQPTSLTNAEIKLISVFAPMLKQLTIQWQTDQGSTGNTVLLKDALLSLMP